MSKLIRRMTGKSAEMKKQVKGFDDAELEEMYDLKKIPDSIRGKISSLLVLLKAIRLCNKAKDIDDAVKIIIDTACNILSCDRATVFIVDEVMHELVIKGAVGTTHDIRIPWNAGIAGSVYQSGEKVNIPDAYKDDRFNKETDKTTGYKTVSLMTLPITDETGKTVAVLQAINKKLGTSIKPFSTEDELLGEHMATQVGIILSNHLLTEKTKRAHGQVISLLQIVKSLHSSMGINSLMFTITERSPGLVDADRCTLYLVDRSRNELWSLQGAVEVRIPIDKGLAGACATEGKVINIEDAHKDDRFNKDYDIKTGYRTRSVLVHPIFDSPIDGSKRQVVGVLQMINKLHGGKFDENDENLLGSFLDIAGSILVTSQLFNRAEKKLSEFGAAMNFSKRGEDNKPLEKLKPGLEKQSSGRVGGGRASAVKATLTISEGHEGFEEEEEE